MDWLGVAPVSFFCFWFLLFALCSRFFELTTVAFAVAFHTDSRRRPLLNSLSLSSEK